MSDAMRNVSPIDTAIADVRAELERAMALWPSMRSCHEGISLVREEFDEAWEIVKQKPSKRCLSDLRAELVQVASMAIRMIAETCNEEIGRL